MLSLWLIWTQTLLSTAYMYLIEPVMPASPVDTVYMYFWDFDKEMLTVLCCRKPCSYQQSMPVLWKPSAGFSDYRNYARHAHVSQTLLYLILWALGFLSDVFWVGLCYVIYNTCEDEPESGWTMKGRTWSKYQSPIPFRPIRRGSLNHCALNVSQNHPLEQDY